MSNIEFRQGSRPDLSHQDLVGRSTAFTEAMRLVNRMASCNVAVLLCGETGTGKELAARAIHYLGPRCDFPFIPVNCGAIPEMLVESELFGHSRGAFTDARESQTGLVAQARGGTLFLDEVDSLSIKAQITLLRFLQDGSFRPLGAQTTNHSDARVIAASNANLHKLVDIGTFRSDLLFRLSVVPIHLPPLRERQGDVALLADKFLSSLAQEHGHGPKRVDASSIRRLESYHWPGNVRELYNVISRSFFLAEPGCLTLEVPDPNPLQRETGIGSDLGSKAETMATSFKAAREQALQEFEVKFLLQAMTDSEGNVSLAARRAGQERRSFGRLVKKHGLDRACFESPARGH